MIITARRSIISVLIITVLCAGLVFRIADITSGYYTQASESESSRLLQVAQTRGMIYDRNMKPLVNRESHTVLIVVPTEEAMAELKNQLTAEDYAVAQANAVSGKPFTIGCDGYDGDCADITEVTVYDRYTQDDVAVHLIGYTDESGNGVSGIEKEFNDLLTQFSGSFSFRYEADAAGRALGGMESEISDDGYASSGGVALTIDSDIQRICENAMEWNSLTEGAVVVLDVETSEILAMASAPSYDRTDLSAALADEDSPFINRCLEAYSVGSVFKPIVAAAALEQGISVDNQYTCDGSIDVNSVIFNCHNRSGHGTNDMTSAMALSCNPYFIDLGRQTGAENIISVASALGLGSEIRLFGDTFSKAGSLPGTESIDSLPALANLSFGQGTLLATPLQIAAVYCAFANGGYYREPYVLKYMVDGDGEITAYYKSEVNNKVLTDSVCSKITGMLTETVNSGSGRLASPMVGTAAGKTATAETGQTENGEEILHTWFAGYYPADDPEYVIVVFREKGDSSSTDTAPVFRDIADALSAD